MSLQSISLSRSRGGRRAALTAVAAIFAAGFFAPDAPKASTTETKLAAPISADGVKRLLKPMRAKARVTRAVTGLQCAVYARQRSGVMLNGAARSWWEKAEGVYHRSSAPERGAVMVMGGTRFGHVAVVSEIVDARTVKVDHANWLGRGEITQGALVVDVSEAGDWSAVRVWHAPTQALGLRHYPVFGFIHP